MGGRCKTKESRGGGEEKATKESNRLKKPCSAWGETGNRGGETVGASEGRNSEIREPIKEGGV